MNRELWGKKKRKMKPGMSFPAVVQALATGKYQLPHSPEVRPFIGKSSQAFEIFGKGKRFIPPIDLSALSGCEKSVAGERNGALSPGGSQGGARPLVGIHGKANFPHPTLFPEIHFVINCQYLL
ncbi:MAG TPA: hypothetical protein PLU80_01970 [Acidobacteriota bacterium]|nr:hypothetical protein [Acidobacteriota bacterium]